MNLTLKRTKLAPTSLLGELYIDTTRWCYTLEPLPTRAEHPAIPGGFYALDVSPTHNDRLWTPYADRCLPRLHAVPGREGILIHAGNHSTDTLGCIILGFTQQADSVASSRDAVKALIDLLVHAPGAAHSPDGHWIAVTGWEGL